MMPVTLTIKQVPDELAARLRTLAARNHRSLQGELMRTLEALVSDAVEASPTFRSDTSTATATDDLMERLLAITGGQGIDTTQLLTREQIHDRALSRQTGI
jgi:plasmid stability protein